MLKAKDNVEATPHQGKDASSEQGIKASLAKGESATATPTTEEDTHHYVSILE